ncbi:MAG TPA: SusD/RagB family nutrient-binding outer membrane lipoprotein, partial [Bacteroidales bacterium]|nr:SusD/RagB family nutrient-binding outer membrane lipoprotein [Bacteroidales bacterium]
CDTDELIQLDDPKYLLTPDNSDMSMMFTNILVSHGRGSTGGNPARLEGGYVKYYATYSNLMQMGGLYQFDQGLNDSPWGVYTGALKMAISLEDFLVKKADPLQVNNLAMTRIMKVAIIQRLTDFYGDIPITEAGLAYIDGTMKPKYDKQADIYKYMLQTLDAETKALSTDPAILALTWKGNADPKKARDIVYNGDINKWKKYGYSLMLRLAMRASVADATMAKTYAEKAIAGGVITSNSDNWTLLTKDGMNSEKSPYSSFFEGSPSGDPERYMKMGEYFVDFLKAKADPRRKVIFGGRLNNTITAVTASNMQTYWRDVTKWDWDITAAKGMIHGTNANPAPSLAAYHWTYTSPNPFLFTMDQPLVIMTAAEMNYLIAEAALNGWTTGTTADAAYATAITASMTQLSSYTGLLATQKILASEITDYITANPLGTGTEARQRLAEEMWVSLFMNPTESWFNVRRMNLNLPSNSSTAQMPVRYAYVENERSNNLDNLNAALTALGWATSMTRETEIAQKVWWDKN